MASKTGAIPPAPDSGWSYMVLLGACLALASRGWMIRGNGLIYQELHEKFGRSATETALVFALTAIFRSIGGPIASISCTRFGFRKTIAVATLFSVIGMLVSAFSPNLYVVYVAYGALLGLTVVTIDTSTFIIISQYFDKKRAMAMGIATAGMEVGGLILTPVITVLIQQYGYSGCLLVLAAIFLHGFISSLLYLPLKWPKIKHADKELQFVITETGSAVLEDESTVPTENNRRNLEDVKQRRTKLSNLCNSMSNCLNLELLKKKEVLSFNLLVMSFTLAVYLLLTFFAGFVKERNITLKNLAIILAVDSAVGVLSRFLTGFLFDLDWVKARRLLIYVTLCCCCTFWLAIIPIMKNAVGFAFACSMCTIFASQFDSQQVTILGDLVERSKLAAAIGQNRLFKGIGMAIAPAFGGLMKDWSGHYDYSFYVAFAIVIVGIIGMIIGNYRLLMKQCNCRHSQT